MDKQLQETLDEFRGDVAMQLRDWGHEEAANYYGALPDEIVELDYQDSNGDVEYCAHFVGLARTIEEILNG